MKKPAAKRPGSSQADKIPSDDAALFRTAIGAVKPLAEQNRITPQPSPRKPFRASTPPLAIPDTLSDSAAHASKNADAPSEYLGNGLSRMSLRKLRRGSWPIQDRLDLHGLHSDAARKLLQAFLHEAAQRELRCVLLIHGKGMNSAGGEAVLRKLARNWLTQHPNVLGYCDAPTREGGSGAVVILLKVKFDKK